MQLSDLIPTHNELRSMEVAELWRKFFEDGKVMRCNPVSLSEIEGEIYIHDGHHRLAGLWLAGGRSLYDGEYRLRQFSVADYLNVNYDRGYVTPFNPQTEVRLSDFKQIKDRILENKWDEQYIHGVAYLWKEHRLIDSLEQLCSRQ